MFFSSRVRHTVCALVTGVQTCAPPICDDVTHLLAAEHLEHRCTCRAGRLTVVVGALEGTVGTEHEGRAGVPRIPVLLAQSIDHRTGGALVLRLEERLVGKGGGRTG